jgi:hypothetical protein
MKYDLIYTAIFSKENDVYFQTWAGLMSNIQHDLDNKEGLNVFQVDQGENKPYKLYGDHKLLHMEESKKPVEPEKPEEPSNKG